MRARLGVSGSTILSDPAQFQQMFWEGIDHIEIGELPDEGAFETVLEMCRTHQVTFGIHSPLYRHQSKYDLLQRVNFEPEIAWSQLETEAQKLQALGAAYILVHFPYFKETVSFDVHPLIDKGLERIRALQQKVAIPIICEPKLGLNQSNAGIHYFHDSLVEAWEGVGICVDLGDFLIATGERMLEHLVKWKHLIRVVHLHNVEFIDDHKYWWIPVHPSHEDDGVHYRIAEIIEFLTSCPDVTFVFEHTPHSKPSEEFVREGYEWMQQLVKGQQS